MRVKTVIGAAAIAATVSVAAQAAMITGKLDIDGSVIDSNFVPNEQGGFVDFLNDSGEANVATGSFAPFVNDNFDPGTNTPFTLNDLVFDVGEIIYFNDDIAFEVTEYSMFDNDPDPLAGFSANGIIRLTGFDDTPGIFALSVQQDLAMVSFSSSTVANATAIPVPASVFMLLAALGGFGLLSRRGRSAA